MAAGKRRRSRSAKSVDDKRRTLSTRISDEVRSQLEQAAAASGRSLSQEIELRLERSFNDDASIAAIIASEFGGDRTATVLRRLAVIAQQMSGETGETHWLDDQLTFEEVRRQWEILIDELSPRGSPRMRALLDGTRDLLNALDEEQVPPGDRQRLLSLARRMAETMDLPPAARTEFAALLFRHERKE